MRSLLNRLTKSEFLKNVFTLVSATGIAQAISLAIYPVLTRIYTPEEHGLFALYMSIITITAIISTGKYELAVMIPRKDKDGAGLTLLGIMLSLGFSLFLLLFIFVFRDPLPRWLGNQYIDKWIFFIPLSTFMVGVFQVLSFWMNRRSAYRAIAGANLSQSIFNSAVKLSASKAMSHGGGLMTGAIVGQFVGAVVYTWRIFRNGTGIFRSVSFPDLRKLAREYWFFPRYSMMHKLINNFSSSLPVFVFSAYFGADIVGYFGLGFMLINRPMNLLSTSFSKVYSQRTIERHNNGQLVLADIRKFVIRMAWISAIPFLVILCCAPWLVTIIFGDEWHEAGVYMQIFAPWLFMVFLSAPLSFVADMLSRQRKALAIEVVKFIARIIALGIGVIGKDVYLALMLFSGFSFVIVTYNLYWYMVLARKADQGKDG
ncbi:MAG: oligosaccharide flippase family protein [Bacteroidales bacterium]|nr:oligosaccharide flippase family protein [Bacteroidales bacterium]MDT8431824.1 oligosaccharide flippase family protein [Bacteroidales bacterium]